MSSDLEKFADEINSGLEDDFFSCFKTLDNFAEGEASWIVPGWIPAEQITLLAAEGGIGKTSLWVDLLSALSSGRRCVLDPPELIRSPARVAFLASEDSVTKKLKRKLREAGADETNIITADTTAAKSGMLRELKFGTPFMEAFIRHFRPALCVFDPVQGFVPPDVNMGSRNAMRDCMAPLVALGEEVGTTFIVVCHTNKRKGASGRDRIADSADLWDIARSVLMAGYSEDQGIRYLSQEKSNYGSLQQTILFSIDETGIIHNEGTTWKHDRDFASEYAANTTPSKRVGCEAWITDQLKNGRIRLAELYDGAEDAGYSTATIRRAVESLSKCNKIRRWQTGYGTGKTWYAEMVSPCDPSE